MMGAQSCAGSAEARCTLRASFSKRCFCTIVTRVLVAAAGVLVVVLTLGVAAEMPEGLALAEDAGRTAGRAAEVLGGLTLVEAAGGAAPGARGNAVGALKDFTLAGANAGCLGGGCTVSGCTGACCTFCGVVPTFCMVGFSTMGSALEICKLVALLAYEIVEAVGGCAKKEVSGPLRRQKSANWTDPVAYCPCGTWRCGSMNRQYSLNWSCPDTCRGGKVGGVISTPPMADGASDDGAGELAMGTRC